MKSIKNLKDPNVVMINENPEYDGKFLYCGKGTNSFMKVKEVINPREVSNKFVITNVGSFQTYGSKDYIYATLKNVENERISIDTTIDIRVVLDVLRGKLGLSNVVDEFSIVFDGHKEKVILHRDLEKYKEVFRNQEKEKLKENKKIEQTNKNLLENSLCIIVPYGLETTVREDTNLDRLLFPIFKYNGYDKFPRMNNNYTKIVGKSSKVHGFNFDGMMGISRDFLKFLVMKIAKVDTYKEVQEFMKENYIYVISNLYSNNWEDLVNEFHNEYDGKFAYKYIQTFVMNSNMFSNNYGRKVYNDNNLRDSKMYYTTKDLKKALMENTIKFVTLKQDRENEFKNGLRLKVEEERQLYDFMSNNVSVTDDSLNDFEKFISKIFKKDGYFDWYAYKFKGVVNSIFNRMIQDLYNEGKEQEVEQFMENYSNYIQRGLEKF